MTDLEARVAEALPCDGYTCYHSGGEDAEHSQRCTIRHRSAVLALIREERAREAELWAETFGYVGIGPHRHMIPWVKERLAALAAEQVKP